jgi:hypothetical protein
MWFGGRVRRPGFAHALSSMNCLSLGSMRRQGFRGKALDTSEQQLVQSLVGPG